MKIDYKNTHTILFTALIDGKNTVTAIGLINNKDLEAFADRWENQEKINNRFEISEDYISEQDFMEKVRNDFKKAEEKLRKK